MTTAVPGVVDTATQVLKKVEELGEKALTSLEAKNATLHQMIGSVALHTVSRVSEKNEDYLSREVSGWDPALLTSRAHHFEAGFISFVCLVHNCILALIFALSALVSLCKDPKINFTAKQLLLVSGMSGASIGICVLGLFSPTLADRVYKNLADCLWESKEGIRNFLGDAR